MLNPINWQSVKSKSYKVFIVGGNLSYSKVLESFILVHNVENADLVIFTGGGDVSPDMYGEPEGKHTSTEPYRDRSEALIFQQCVLQDKPMLGVCRGAQFLTVMSGGKLIQHVENHAIYGVHNMKLINGKTVAITSTHHQMMYPFSLDEGNYDILAWATPTRTTVMLNGLNENIVKDEKIICEPEIVYYWNSRSLCIQGHPERMDEKSPTVYEVREMIDKLVENKMNLYINEALNV